MVIISNKAKFIKGMSELQEFDFMNSDVLNNHIEYMEELTDIVEKYIQNKLLDLSDKDLESMAESFLSECENDEYAIQLGLDIWEAE